MRKLANKIGEALLEMYFFKPLIEYYSNTYGAKFLNIHKPSPQDEVWIGYDQGWTHSSLSQEQLLNKLKEAIQNKATTLNTFYLGFFLQFKIVSIMSRNSRNKPDNYTLPYYRSEISLKINKKTGLSQHQTLKRLSRIDNASVVYACGMIFDNNDIYKNPDLSDLRMIPVKDSPDYDEKDERHFITFQTKDDPSPLYHSEPVETSSFSAKEWIIGETNHSPKRMDAKQIMDLISVTEKEILTYKQEQRLEKAKSKELSDHTSKLLGNNFEFDLLESEKKQKKTHTDKYECLTILEFMNK